MKYITLKKLVCLIPFITPHLSIAQIIDDQSQQNIELYAEQAQNEYIDYSTLIENLNYFRSHPLNLNTANKENLLELPYINEIQVCNLLKHIEICGKLMNIYELQAIDGFDISFIRKILPYVKVCGISDYSLPDLNYILKHGSHEVISRYQRIIEHQAGYSSSSDSANTAYSPNENYLGSPDKLYLRYRFNYLNSISVGFISEKDPGETLLKIDSLHKKAGFDFNTFHFTLKNKSLIKYITIGDYQAHFGQGLVLWKGFNFGKTSSILSVKKNSSGFKPYSSADENNFLRGVAGTFKIGKFDLSLFYSRKKSDALIYREYSPIEKKKTSHIQSIIETGTHATISELKTKNTITETVTGVNISYNTKQLHIGVTTQQYLLSTDLIKTPTLYNQYDFNGHKNINAGIDFSYVYKNINLFSETALGLNGGKAGIFGAIICPDQKLNLVMVYRKYEKNFQNTLAATLSENTHPQNEDGIYAGFEVSLNSKIGLHVYIDQFRFPWLKYKLYKPGSGYDFLSQIDYKLNSKTEVYLRYRYHRKEGNANNMSYYIYAIPVAQNNFRINISSQITPFLKIHSRAEFLSYTKSGEASEQGVLLIQDIEYKRSQSPVGICVRYSIFESSSYNSRIYAYESDVPFSFSIPSNFYQGNRYYIIVNYLLNKHLEFWVKFSQTCYTNKNIQNEGTPNQINSPKKSEIKLEMKYKF